MPTSSRVDQDPLVAAAAPAQRDPRVLVKPLAGGDVAVALFNADERPATITTNAAFLGLPAAPCYSVRDLWSHTDSTGAGRHQPAGSPARRGDVAHFPPL